MGICSTLGHTNNLAPIDMLVIGPLSAAQTTLQLAYPRTSGALMKLDTAGLKVSLPPARKNSLKNIGFHLGR